MGFFLLIGVLAGIAGWILYPWIIQREPDRPITWPGRRAQLITRYGHFRDKAAVEYSVVVSEDAVALSNSLAEMLVSPPNTPSELIITNQTPDQISFENTNLSVWPGRPGSYRSKELSFSQGHFHLDKINAKILVTYGLDFSKVWQFAKISAYLNLGLWGTLQVVVPIILWYALKQYPQYRTLPLFSLYLLAFSWSPYWPLVVFRKLKRNSCRAVEKIILDSVAIQSPRNGGME